MSGPPLPNPFGRILQRVPGYPFAVNIAARLPDNLGAPAEARALLRRTLADWDLASAIDDAEIVASELVANALRHGAMPVSVMLGVADGRLTISVEDAAAARVPEPRDAGAGDTGGRGMHLISALSEQWGCDSDGVTKVVWAALPLP